MLTLVLFCASAELLARSLFRESPTSTLACLVTGDAATGVRARPDTVCRQKIFESAAVEYRFNRCGFRTPQGCGPAPAGAYRIVLIGSSISFGMHVAREQSFAAKLGPALAARTGRSIDVFNESMQWGTPASLALRTASMIAAHPDMIVWTLTPFDIVNGRLILPYIGGVQEGVEAPAEKVGGAPMPTAEPHTLATVPARAWRRLIADVSDTRTVFMLRHYLYSSQSQYLSHTLAQGPAIDYLRDRPTPALDAGLASFSRSLDLVAACAKKAGVPLIVTLLPSRPQTIMLAEHDWPAGYDPHLLGRLVKRVVVAHDARYVDMTRDVAGQANAGDLFFPVDEHLPPEGHTMLARMLADALVRSNAIPPVGAAK